MQELLNSIKILIQVANVAQSKGLLTLDEAVSVKQSIDIQTKYYNDLSAPKKMEKPPYENGAVPIEEVAEDEITG